jgi:hypothetical protein
MNIHDLFEEKARAGDGRFAIAFAIMELAEAHKSVATWYLADILRRATCRGTSVRLYRKSVLSS